MIRAKGRGGRGIRARWEGRPRCEERATGLAGLRAWIEDDSPFYRVKGDLSASVRTLRDDAAGNYSGV